MKRTEPGATLDGERVSVPKDLKKLLNLSYLRYTNLTRAVGDKGLPKIVCRTKLMPDYIALYNHPADYDHTALTAVGFFLYDKEFDGRDGLYNAIYYRDEERLDWFKRRFTGVRMFIMPDMSQLGDVDDLENNYRLKKMRVVSLWLTVELGAVVIPLVTFPTVESIDFALDGYEDCTVVCFSTKGAMTSKTERTILREAVKHTVDALTQLEDIVVYDVCGDNDKALDLFAYATGRGIRVHLPDNMLKARNRTKLEGGEAHAQ